MDPIAEAWQHVLQARRLVVKIGSSLLARGEENQLDREWIAARCQEIARLLDQGRQVVVVTSGAVAAGRPRLKLGNRPLTLREKQAAAAAGQGVLMGRYEEAFAAMGRHAAQILLTQEDCQSRQRYLNARDTLMTLLNLGLVPVVNENDTVATREIRFGDNDTLAANVVDLVEADLLLLLSDVPGLFDADPRKNPEARRIELVARVTPAIEALAGGVGSAVASGGMSTKLRAAKMAARRGCPMILTSGRGDNPITAALSGVPCGTLFLAESAPLSSRKRWIANSLRGEGDLHLDAGAARAMVAGNSLLAKGVVQVEGDFHRGAAVFCVAPGGQRIAKGLVNYGAAQIRLVAGRHSSQFETILGFLGDEEVIHRDNLVVLDPEKML